MILAPTPSPTPVGADQERGEDPAASPLSAFCDNCGRPRSAKSLNLICVQERQSHEPKWLLICGPCLVDG